MDLTRKDFDVLIEAVEAWENKDAASAMMGGLMDGLLSRDMKPEQMAEMKARRADEDRKREAARKARKEISVVLRAKLISIRNATAPADKAPGGLTFNADPCFGIPSKA